MYRQILESISGIEIFPIISLCLFFAIFIGVLVWTWRIDKNHIAKMAQLPLENNHVKSNDNGWRQ